jgi:hypothetical protein
MRASMTRLVVLAAQPCLAALGGGVSQANAQEPATLEVTVRTSDSKPLEGAMVVVRGTTLAGATDRRGFIRFPDPGVGVRTVEIRFIGYAPADERVRLAAGSTTGLLVEMVAEPIGLEPVDVHGRASNLVRRGFYERQRAGLGTFLTRADIEEIQPRFLSDVLRRAGGIQVGTSSRGLPPTRIRGQQTITGGCPVQYFVDGVVTTALSIDEVRPDDVDGIEIYRGSSTIPAMFKRGTASCGVILLWTKLR